MINLSKPVVKGIETFGNVIFWIVVVVFAAWVISKFIVNIGIAPGRGRAHGTGTRKGGSIT